jgi:hypothetical protein
MHTVSAADKVVENINNVLKNNKSNLQKLSTKIDNAFMRLSKGKIEDTRDIGMVREIGNTGIQQYVRSSKAQDVIRAAKKIVEQSALPTSFAIGDDKKTRDLRDAHLIINMLERLDDIKTSAHKHQDFGRLMLYSDTRSHFAEDARLSAVTTANQQYATGVLGAMRNGVRAAAIPMNDDVDADTRASYKRFSHGIRPQSYHDMMSQHEDTAREQFNNWSKDYFQYANDEGDGPTQEQTTSEQDINQPRGIEVRGDDGEWQPYSNS